MDRVSKEKRSEIMGKVNSKNTGPELIVRKILHRLKYRFRLHKKNLPGNPDIVLPKHKKIIFVHGCFWHGHENCSKGRLPKTNQQYWQDKIISNRKRDLKAIEELNKLGWKVLVVWSCQIKNQEQLENHITQFLSE